MKYKDKEIKNLGDAEGEKVRLTSCFLDHQTAWLFGQKKYWGSEWKYKKLLVIKIEYD